MDNSLRHHPEGHSEKTRSMKSQKIIITGGSGFIGSALIRHLIRETDHQVLNIDALTYAGNPDSLIEVANHPRYTFARADITDRAALDRLLASFRPDAILHLAAESHVDRSIDCPVAFIQTNIVGTYTLLEATRHYWQTLGPEAQAAFRFLHVSTDEVYGDLHGTDDLFTETMAYEPSSPYSASKASSDHLVRAWMRTYGLPVLVTHCSNNYGPCQFPEKLIPRMIINALQGEPLPLYGDGSQVRDWLYVDDHVRALMTVLQQGKPGETYNIGGHNERQNRDVVENLCDLLEELAPAKPAGVGYYRDLIQRASDRPGHDRRYAIDAGKMERELGWRPSESFESGLRRTVSWYLQNREWWQRVQSGSYRHGSPTLIHNSDRTQA